ARTVTPVFYNGRAEPSAGSVVRAVAVVESAVTADNLRYRWELNGSLLSGTNMVGDRVTFIAPIGNGFRVRVDAFNAAGTRVATGETYVNVSESFIAFYPNNLLHGLSRTAIADTHILTGGEVSVRAEPYFMDLGIFSSPHQINWRVN